MLGLALLVALSQDTLPTVGDTLWAVHRFSVPAGVSVRPRPARAADRIEPLGPPELRLVDGMVELRYALVAWEPGVHAVTLPGAILVRDDGWSDTLPDWTASLKVASVLPAGPRDSLAAQPPAALVVRTDRSLLPLLLLCLMALLGLVPLHVTWRRRGPRMVSPAAAARPPAPDRLGAWAREGELRAAIEGWCQRLGEGGPPGSDPARDALLEALRAARYAPASEAELALLCRRAAAFSEEGVA